MATLALLIIELRCFSVFRKLQQQQILFTVLHTNDFSRMYRAFRSAKQNMGGEQLSS